MTSVQMLRLSNGPDRATLHAALMEGIECQFDADVPNHPNVVPQKLRVIITMIRAKNPARRNWDIEGKIMSWESGHSYSVGAVFTGYYDCVNTRFGRIDPEF